MLKHRPSTFSRALTLTALPVLAFVLQSCGARTSVTGTWLEQPSGAVPFRHVLVIGVSPNSRVRRSFEIALAEELAARGGKASAAVQTPESRPQLAPQIVSSMVRSTGADAVLVTRLASRKVSAEETQGRVGVKTQRPMNLNGGAGLVELFSLDYQEYEEPGELRATSTAVVESSLYEADNSGRLIFTLTTTSEFREGRDDVIGDVAKAIATKLRREGLVR